MMDSRYNALFWTKPDALAQSLIGAYICIAENGEIKRYQITETEAYFGHEPFCYGYGGKNPKRKSAMFYSVGKVCYYYSMFMVSCYSESCPDNILIRAVKTTLKTVSGPILSANAMGITDRLNGADLAKKDRIWIEYADEHPEIITRKRKGIVSSQLWQFRMK